MKKIYSLFIFLFLVIASQAQGPYGAWLESQYLKINGPQDEWKWTNFYEIQKAFYAYEKDYETAHPYVNLRTDNENPEEEINAVPGRLQFKRWEYFMEPKVYPSGDIALAERNDLETWKQRQSTKRLTAVDAANWTSMGPTNDSLSMSKPCMGRINFIKVHPTNTNIYWAGSASGGLWKSVNAGSTWSSVSIPTPYSTDMVFHPTNPNIMFLATGDADGGGGSIGILKSTDGGTTWNATGLGSGYTKIHRIIIHPVNPNIMFAATYVGLAKTIDGGTTWTVDTALTTHIWDVKFKPGDPTVVYAATRWSMYKSTDTGNTFTNITSGIPATDCRKCLAVSANNPSYVYMLCTNNDIIGIYRSTDSGNNFTQRTIPAANLMQGQGYYDAVIAATPWDANEIYAEGVWSNWRSMDGGATWGGFGQSGPAGHGDIHSIEILSSTLMFICSDGGIVRSTDDGATLNSISDGLVVSQLYYFSTSQSNASVMVDAEQDNGVKIKTATGWRQVHQGDATGSMIDYTNADIIYFADHGGQLRKTMNGTSASPTITFLLNVGGSGANSTGIWKTPFAMHPTDPNTILVGKNYIYRSTDGGVNWSAALPGTSGTASISNIAYAPSNPNYIYASNNFLNIYRSIDGNTFTDISSNFIFWGFVSGIAVSSTNPQKVWVSNGDSVEYSSDAGQTWTGFNTGLPGGNISSIIYQNGSNDGLYLSIGASVYYRDATMSSWVSYSMGLPYASITHLEIQYSSGKIRASTYGRGMWESDLYVTGIDELNKSEASISVYPNPATDNITITINGQSSIHNNQLSVYNLLGEKIYSEALSSKVKILNVEQFSAGIYFVKVSDGEKQFIQKLIVQ